MLRTISRAGAVLLALLMMTGCLVMMPGEVSAATLDWEDIGDTPFKVASTSNAQLADGRFFVTAGFNTTTSSADNQSWILDPSTMSWERVADSPNGIQSGCAAALPNNNVYCFGGLDISSMPIPNVLIYDVDENTWTTGPACPLTGYFVRATALDDHRILIVGGDTGVSDCYVYDERTNAFAQVSDIPSPRSAGALIQAGDLVYYFGGFDGVSQPQDEVFAYDYVHDSWSLCCYLPDENQGVQGALSADGMIYLVGGGSDMGWGGTNSLAAYAFDPRDNSFTYLTDAPKALRYCAVLTTDGGEMMFFSGHESSGTVNQNVYSLELWSIEASLDVNTIGQGESAWLSLHITNNFVDSDGLWGCAHLTAMGVTFASYDFSADGGMVAVELHISQDAPLLGYVVEISGVSTRSGSLEDYSIEPIALTVTDTPSDDERLDDLQDQISNLSADLNLTNDQLDDLAEQNEDLQDQLNETQAALDASNEELNDAISAKQDAMFGYIILVLVIISLVVGVVILVRKK